MERMDAEGFVPVEPSRQPATPNEDCAVEEIIEQGEGARSEWQTAHYGRFLEVYDEHAAMLAGDASFGTAGRCWLPSP